VLIRRPDGAQVFWTSAGKGMPAAVLCDGLGCDGFIWKYLQPALARKHLVVHFHYRGHGRSPLPPESAPLSVATLADDLAAVLDAAGLTRAVLFGHSMGVQVALEAHRRHPGRVEALVLVCGSPGHPLDTFHDTNLLRRLLPTLRRAAERVPAGVSALTRGLVRSGLAMELALLLEVNPALVQRTDLLPYFTHLEHMDPRLFVRTMDAAGKHSAENHLPSVDVPVLVLAGDRDRFTPPWLSRRMALSVPGAELVLVHGGSHTMPLEAPKKVERAVADFLRRRVPG
jgi:pimeloyl-ACP methyl ester carboxylesterase